EVEADGGEADGDFFADAEGAAEVEVAFGRDTTAADGDVEGGGDGPQRDAGTAHQCFQKHVAGAGGRAVAAGGGVQPRLDERLAGGTLARHPRAERPRRFQCQPGGVGLVLVAGLHGGLQGAELFGVHAYLSLVYLVPTLCEGTSLQST